uniref:Uncharacterized protein n=1 Tax=Romanomermis culicivorax TaxID=13658 RepID=A0A915IXR0_ROMCU
MEDQTGQNVYPAQSVFCHPKVCFNFFGNIAQSLASRTFGEKRQKIFTLIATSRQFRVDRHVAEITTSCGVVNKIAPSTPAQGAAVDVSNCTMDKCSSEVPGGVSMTI